MKFKLESYNRNISKEELFKNVEEVWVKLGKQPKSRDMTIPFSKYSVKPYKNRFGTWRKALTEFILFINPDTDENERISGGENNVGINNETEIIYKHKTKREPSERLKVQVLMRDGNKCRLCGITVTGENIHFDHIKPWSKCGETVLENLQILCSLHNRAKGDLEYESK